MGDDKVPFPSSTTLTNKGATMVYSSPSGLFMVTLSILFLEVMTDKKSGCIKKLL